MPQCIISIVLSLHYQCLCRFLWVYKASLWGKSWVESEQHSYWIKTQTTSLMSLLTKASGWSVPGSHRHFCIWKHVLMFNLSQGCSHNGTRVAMSKSLEMFAEKLPIWIMWGVLARVQRQTQAGTFPIQWSLQMNKIQWTLFLPPASWQTPMKLLVWTQYRSSLHCVTQLTFLCVLV